MNGGVAAVTPVAYVRDLASVKAFYELIGFTEDKQGSRDNAHWSYLRCGDVSLLLAWVEPPLITVELPMAFYLFVDDVDATAARLSAAGHATTHVGHPEHAPGGEVRTADPDGNTIVLGQRDPKVKPVRVTVAEPVHFSFLKEAAQAAVALGEMPQYCKLGAYLDEPCLAAAEIKVADSQGETIWCCMPHAESLLLNVPGAFIASSSQDGGLGPYLKQLKAG